MPHAPARPQPCDRPQRCPNPNNSDSIAYDVECQNCDAFLCISCGHHHVDEVGQICDGCASD